MFHATTHIGRTVLLLAAAAAIPLLPAQSGEEFEAASVKLETPPKDGRYSIGPIFNPGQFVGSYMTMYDLIQLAYAVPAGHKIIGPDWLTADSTRYLVNAKAAGPATPKELRVMLQHLLIERFALKVHTEDRPAPIYALVVSPKGIKLTPVKFDDTDPNLRSRRIVPTGVEFQHTSMASLANWLTVIGRPVVDETGIHDLFDFKLSYANRGGFPLLTPAAGASTEASNGGSDLPSIFEAVQQLGLKLESRQGPVSFYIVDHVERVPTEN